MNLNLYLGEINKCRIIEILTDLSTKNYFYTLRHY